MTRLPWIATLVSLGAACAPPPLPEGSGTSIDILFPEARTDITVCPNFVMVVDIQNLELTDPEATGGNEEGEGHWHLKIQGEHVGSVYQLWAPVSLGDDTSGPMILTAALADNEHNEVGIDATTEIIVSSEEGCVGGGGGGGIGTDSCSMY
jgi:hypothetical protein